MSDVEMEVESSAIAVDSGGKLQELVEKFKTSVSQIGSAKNTESKDVSELCDIIRECMKQFLPTLQDILNLPEPKDPTKVVLPSPKNKKWKAIQGTIKTYLVTVIQALSITDLTELIMEYLPQIIAYYSCFPKLSKVAMEKLVVIWGSEADQLIAVNCINRLMRHVPPKQFEESLTRMYAVFYKGCKVTTANSLPLINYMKHSLVETMSIRSDLAYKCAFASIKGMAKKLRTVSDGYRDEKKGTTKKQKLAAQKGEKDGNVAPICNWQHLHVTSFWIALICRLKSDAKMQTLAHHVVEIINDTIRGNSSIQYYPLRFNCLRMLIELCAATDLFVPVLPFLIEVIDSSSLQTKASQNSKTRYNFASTLKVLKTDVHEKAFMDEVVDNCFDLTLQYCVCFRHSVAFPELVQTTIQAIKKFVKNCPVPAYASKMKTLLQKLEEHSNLVKKKRASANLDLHDHFALASLLRQGNRKSAEEPGLSWEQNFRAEKNSLTVFFEASKKKHMERNELIASPEEMVEAEIRTSKRKEKQSQVAKDDAEDESELGGRNEDDVSDEDEDSSDDDAAAAEDDVGSFDEEDMEFEDTSDSGGDA